MVKVAQDAVEEGLPLGEERAKDEESGGIEGNEKNTEAPTAETTSTTSRFTKKRTLIAIAIVIAAIALIIGLSVGLTQRNKNNDNNDIDETNASSAGIDIVPDSTTPNPNLQIFDDALAVLKSTPRQQKLLPSGETMSFREYNVGQPYKLVSLPGFMNDDVMASIMAVLPQFQDHHIIAVNPIGWNGSTMKKPIYSHEENADQVMQLLKELGIEKAMAMGYSTGGGLAFYMAKNYPDIINAAFLAHSIPLDGARSTDENGSPIVLEMDDIEEMVLTYPTDYDSLFEFFKSHSSRPETFIPKDHELVEYFYDAAVNMPGKVEAWKANFDFNVCPIKTPYADPSDALASLTSPVIVIHGSNDFAVPSGHVESLTKLAIIDGWAPPGKLLLYDDGEGHLVLFDNPDAFARVYREAFEFQVLIPNGINPSMKVFDDAIMILEETPRQEKFLPTRNETMSYREYNVGQPHKLVFLPGFGEDDTVASILAALPQFQDHHIIAVNPIGWYGTTMKKPISNHEENADAVMELLKEIGIEQAMAMGFSTGGGIAFWIAQKYPKTITTAFLAHSIPLNGLIFYDLKGNLIQPNVESIDPALQVIFPDDDADELYNVLSTGFSANSDGYVPKDHEIFKLNFEASANMTGAVEATIANIEFNVCPIKTPFADPSDALSSLESKVVVIDGKYDHISPSERVQAVTKLAIAEQWAPAGKLSLYDDGEGHMVFFDRPSAFAKVYRKAFEEQVLS